MATNDTNVQMTIVVRAQDAATKVLRSIGGLIGKVLTAPLKIVANAVKGIFKQFFSLKGVLIGGGIIGVIRSVVDGLSTSKAKFGEVFSLKTQQGINAVDEAFSRLGASIRATVGNLVGDGSGGLAGFLDSISNWLRDNQDAIRSFFRDLVDSFKEIAAIVRGLAGKQFSIGDMLVGDGFKKGLQRQKEYDLALARFENARKSKFIGSAGTGTGSLEQLSENGRGLSSTAIDAKVALDAYDVEVNKIGVNTKFASENIKAMTAGLHQAAAAMEGMTVHGKAAAEIVSKIDDASAPLPDNIEKVTHAVTELKVEVAELIPIIEGYINVGEASELVAGTMTDGFIDIVQGTATVGQAFGRMVSTILGELGRLLVYKSLLGLLVSVGSSLFRGEAALGGGLSGGDAGAFGSDFTPPTGYASGGRVQRNGVVRVGENGPETVALPGGSHVTPSQRSRGGNGGPTINVYGARDAKATAREVAAAIRYDAKLRRAFA